MNAPIRSSKGFVKQIYGPLDGLHSGIPVSSSELDFAFGELSSQTNADDYLTRTARQARRDNGLFHITVITPNEYSAVLLKNSDEFAGGQLVSYSMLGLGRAQSVQNECFLVVVESHEIQAIRKAVGLDAKDLHITIGFYPSAVHSFRKDRSSLLQPERTLGDCNA